MLKGNMPENQLALFPFTDDHPAYRDFLPSAREASLVVERIGSDIGGTALAGANEVAEAQASEVSEDL